jgi:hypothetical protein
LIIYWYILIKEEMPMNMLAALAELAISESNLEDRSVVDTVIEEFSERMGHLAEIMHEIYGEATKGFIQTL